MQPSLGTPRARASPPPGTPPRPPGVASHPSGIPPSAYVSTRRARPQCRFTSPRASSVRPVMLLPAGDPPGARPHHSHPCPTRPASHPKRSRIRPKNPPKTVSRQPEPRKGFGLARDSSPFIPHAPDTSATMARRAENLARRPRRAIRSVRRHPAAPGCWPPLACCSGWRWPRPAASRVPRRPLSAASAAQPDPPAAP